MKYKFQVGDLVEIVDTGVLALVKSRRRQAPHHRPTSPDEIYTLLFPDSWECDKVGSILRKAGESNEL